MDSSKATPNVGGDAYMLHCRHVCWTISTLHIYKLYNASASSRNKFVTDTGWINSQCRIVRGIGIANILEIIETSFRYQPCYDFDECII